MPRFTSYGYGDSQTWPPYSGNPNDPRCPDDGDDAYDYELAARADHETKEDEDYDYA